LTKRLLFAVINLEKKTDLALREASRATSELREMTRMKFLGDLSLWVRDTHLKTLVNDITVQRCLRKFKRPKRTKNPERVREVNVLDYMPGIVKYLSAGCDKTQMWMEAEELRTLSVENYEVIEKAAQPFYDVRTILLQSAERKEQFHVVYPILRDEGTKVQSLQSFLNLAPHYFHTLRPEDEYEVNRKLEVLTSIYDELRFWETEDIMDAMFTDS
jgi:hypothetical protein